MIEDKSEQLRLPPLSLPPVDLRLRNEDGILKVWDVLRSKFVALTPEEYVRTHFVDWMMKTKGYPANLLVNEYTIEVNGCRRRCDTIAFTPEGKPLVIVEYKAPMVAVTQNVFDQIVRYNMALHARYLVVSNGLHHYCCVVDYKNRSYNFIPEIPDYSSLRRLHGEN